MLVGGLAICLCLLHAAVSLVSPENDYESLASEMRAYRAEVQSLMKPLMQKNEELEKSLNEEKIKIYELEHKISAIGHNDIPPGNINTAIGFSVLLTQNHSPVVGQNIPYDEVITNVGNGWSIATHEFRAPEAGLYLFFAKCRSLTSVVLYIHREAEPVLRFWGNDSPSINGATMVVLNLDEGERVSVRRRSGDTGGTLRGDLEYNTFSGVKIQ